MYGPSDCFNKTCLLDLLHSHCDGGPTEAGGVVIALTGAHLSYATIFHPCRFNILIVWLVGLVK